MDAVSYLCLLAARWDRSQPEPTDEERAELRKIENERRFRAMLWAGVE
jgi:hypothetical protein